MAESEVFLISSFLDNPESLFQGYCFVGSDYVFGDEGAAAYARARGHAIGAGEDGCYVSMRRDALDYIFDVDFSGNKKLYYAWSPYYWVVSNSIAEMVEHLRVNGVSVSPNFAQLLAAGHGARNSALNQTASYSTIVNEVRLAPLGASLRIGKTGMAIMPYRALDTEQDYVGALADFCSLWVSRLATLLRHGVDVRADLTGGVDSRAVVGLLESAIRSAGGGGALNVGVRSGTVRGDTADLEIASGIAAALGLAINEKSRPRGVRLSARESYGVWRALNLGIYHPVYFPRSGLHPSVVALGGGGGENHRRFYKDDSFESLTERSTKRLPNNWLAAQFKREMTEAGAYLSNSQGADADLLILHYRHFRNRFHTGRAPQQSVLFSPLASKSLEKASALVGGALRHNGQVNYDIMASVAPHLLQFDFDSPAKALTAERRDAVTRVEFDQGDSGELFVGPPRMPGGDESNGTQLEFLAEEFGRAAAHPLIKEFWGADWLSLLRGGLREAVSSGALAHAIDGQPVSAVIASHLVLR